MSKRLEILKKSLEKKKARFDEKLDSHFADVRSTNGQPLNDKRNGRATMNRWRKQNNTLHNLEESIEKTKSAIEWEERTIRQIEVTKATFPTEIITLLENGTLKPWRKHPHILFVDGVDKARIDWDEKKQIVAHKYTSSITDPEQHKKFAQVYNALYAAINAKNKSK